jgi:hypothetical protein
MKTGRTSRSTFASLLVYFAAITISALVTPAAAQPEDYSDLFEPKSLGLETLRDAEGRYALQFMPVEAGGMALAAFALVHPREDREVQLTETRSFAYDQGKRSLAIAFPRNDGGLREVTGTFATADRPGFVIRTFAATLLFEGNRKVEIALRGAQMRPKGKRGCAVDAFPGANLANLTLKSPWKPDSGEWVREVAARENWTVLRRRIDYRKGEDEFDVIAPPGRELAAIAAATAIERLTCFSFGVEDTEGADAVRIIELPAGTVFAGAERTELKPLAEIGKLFQLPRLEGLGAGVEIEPGAGSEPFALTLEAPGRFFGFVQGADAAHRVALALRLGRSPGRNGEIDESIRFVVRSVARAKSGGGFEALSFRDAGGAATFETLQIWQSRYAGDLATALGGQVN